MGGTGSSRWTYHDKKRTVEECWRISISDVARIIDLQNPGSASESLRPIKPATGKKMSPVHCVLEVGDDDMPLLRLSYAVKGRWGLEHPIEQDVHLQTTRPHFGGERWWFSCPRMVDDEECGRRLGKLYRPPGDRYFACRHCLDLTYESCQESHRYDRLGALLAGKPPGRRSRP